MPNKVWTLNKLVKHKTFYSQYIIWFMVTEQKKENCFIFFEIDNCNFSSFSECKNMDEN